MIHNEKHNPSEAIMRLLAWKTNACLLNCTCKSMLFILQLSISNKHCSQQFVSRSLSGQNTAACLPYHGIQGALALFWRQEKKGE